MNEMLRAGELNCVAINHNAGTQPKAAVIFCHGFGAPGNDLVPIADEMIRADSDLQDMVFLFPQAPIELDPFYDSRAWWMIDIAKIQTLMHTGEFRELRNSVPADLDVRRKQIFEVIDRVKRDYGLPADKVVVGGFSQGSMLMTEVALNYPESLAGLVIWSGTLMNEENWNAAARRRASMQIVQSHGYSDPILPFVGAEFLRDMFRKHGHHVNFVPFQGEHGIGMEAFQAAAELLKLVVAGREHGD